MQKRAKTTLHAAVLAVSSFWANHTSVHAQGPHFRKVWMRVTYYTWTGHPMKNGLYPRIGWAACGLDLRLGQHVYVPHVGMLTCGDRIPPVSGNWRHIDVYGIPLGSGPRLVTVYP